MDSRMHRYKQEKDKKREKPKLLSILLPFTMLSVPIKRNAFSNPKLLTAGIFACRESIESRLSNKNAHTERRMSALYAHSGLASAAFRRAHQTLPVEKPLVFRQADVHLGYFSLSVIITISLKAA